MKQNQDQIPKIYQELGRQLHLPETRIAAIEQQILEKAEKQKHTPAAFIRAEKRRFGTENWLAYRLAPLVVCAVLAVTGSMIYRTASMKPAEYETAESDVGITEETGTYARTDLTTGGDQHAETITTIVTVSPDAETGSAKGGGKAETTAATAGETETQSQAAETQETKTETSAAETENAAPETTEAAEGTTIPATTALPAETTAASETEDPDAPPVVTEVVTLPLPEIVLPETPEDAVLALDNVRARAGETVTVSVYVPHEISVFGLQFYLQISSLSDVPLPEIVSYRVPAEKLRLPLTQNIQAEDGFVCISFASMTEHELAEGTELFNMTLQIPADAPSGTVYQLEDPTGTYKAVSREYPTGIPGMYYIGNIYVE